MYWKSMGLMIYTAAMTACVALPSAGGGPTSTAVSATYNVAVGDRPSLATLLRDQVGNVPAGGITWSSNAPGTLAVDPLTGQAIAQAPGTALVTAFVTGNSAVATSLMVVVGAKDDVKTVDVFPVFVNLPVGETKPLQAAVKSAEGVVSGGVTWTSSDPSIARVDPATGVVTALKSGHVTITAALSGDARVKGISVVEIGTSPTVPVLTTGDMVAPAGGTLVEGPGVVGALPLAPPLLPTGADRGDVVPIFNPAHGTGAGGGPFNPRAPLATPPPENTGPFNPTEPRASSFDEPSDGSTADPDGGTEDGDDEE